MVPVFARAWPDLTQWNPCSFVGLNPQIQFSAAVNRSFTSSMEVGVRIMKEDPTEAGKLTYVSHGEHLSFSGGVPSHRFHLTCVLFCTSAPLPTTQPI